MQRLTMFYSVDIAGSDSEAEQGMVWNALSASVAIFALC